MRRRRKLNVVHHGDPSLEKEQPIDSSNEVNKEGSHIETHCEKKTRDMPESYINDMIELIQSKFRFVPELTEQTTQILKDNMNSKWKQFKHDLKSKGYDESKTEEEMTTNVPDKRVDPSQYRALVHHWCSEKGKKISQINKRNRSKFEDLHCMGTKNLPRLIHEMTTKAGGVQYCYCPLKRYPMLLMVPLASVNTQQETLIHYIVKVH
ncbi:hypothetical protein P8452_55279 [Trifolium repens]|nr:hypothetical protein P8452_55279 [Trifolium repens]